MKKKGNFRKVVSGLLAGMTMLSTVLSPMTAYAAEIQPEEKPPLYEEVKDLLDEDEVVTAKDYEIETGSVFNVKLVDCLEKCLICRHIRRFAD